MDWQIAALKATLSKYVAFEKLRDGQFVTTHGGGRRDGKLTFSMAMSMRSPLSTFWRWELAARIFVDHDCRKALLGQRTIKLTVIRWLKSADSPARMSLLCAVGGQRALPHAYRRCARRDEIVFAEKDQVEHTDLGVIDNYRKLVEEVMASLDPKTADQISKRPRYIETVGEACPLSVTRITREWVEAESPTRDYEFSRKSIDQHIADGYAQTMKTLKTAGHL
jgi:hypothetical protein